MFYNTKATFWIRGASLKWIFTKLSPFMDFENHRFDHNVYSIGVIFIIFLKLVYKKNKGYILVKNISFVIHFYLIISFYGIRKFQLWSYLLPFNANHIKHHVLDPLMLKRKLKFISRATCRVKSSSLCQFLVM